MICGDFNGTPKVTIVIPVYNGSDYLADAINSALAQTYPNIEVLVVNDGSADDGKSERIALSYGERVRYIKKENGGVASALNLGINEMSGEYFSWLSHDDIYTANKINDQIAFLQTIDAELNKRIVVYSDYAVFSKNPNEAVPVHLPGIAPEKFRHWITTENSLHGCTLLIPKSAFDSVGLFNNNLRTTQDYDLWFRMAMQYSFVHLSACFVKARSHEQQGTKTMPRVVVDEGNALLAKFASQLTDSEVAEANDGDLFVGHSKVAFSFWYRGYALAAWQGVSRAMGSFFQSKWQSRIRGISIIAAGFFSYYIMTPIRKFIPSRFRALIRRFFCKTKSTLVLPSPDVLTNLNLKDRFSKVYTDNIFRGALSRSGAGSDLVQTAVVRHELPLLLEELGIQTMIDAPCGDWFWMRDLKLPVKKYFGVDIVSDLIQKNQELYGDDRHAFICADLSKDKLPECDLIFSRDCLVHLSFSDSLKIIANFKRSGAKYLLTTTFTKRANNVDLNEGFWRTLNLELYPFNFPKPIKVINERCSEDKGAYRDKCLSLWLLEDILV